MNKCCKNCENYKKFGDGCFYYFEGRKECSQAEYKTEEKLDKFMEELGNGERSCKT